MHAEINTTRCGLATLLLLAAGNSLPGRAQTLDERQAYDQIVRSIGEQLQRPDHFTRLPHNVSGLWVAPDRKPVFSILAGSRPEEFKPNAPAKAFLKDEGSFLVSRYGQVVAAFKDQVVLKGAPNDQEKPFVVCSSSGARRLDLPGGAEVSRVFRAGSDWGFVTDGGILLNSATNVPAVLSNRFQPPLAIETGSGFVAITRPDDETGYDTNSHLAVTIKDDRGLKQWLFQGYRQVGLHLQGLLPLSDERFLAVAEKLVVLGEDSPRLEELREGALGMAPARAAELMGAGWQYFAGSWIRNPHLIQQEGTTSLVLEAEFMDRARVPAHGVFRVDHTGQMELLFRHERDGFAPPCQFFKNETGEPLVFFPFEGLARVSGGKLEWLDRSDEMKWFERVIGCDKEGRIYFDSGPSAVSEAQTGFCRPTSQGYEIWATGPRDGDHFWVYRPKAPTGSSPIARLFPVAHLPVMDSANRIWFCPMMPPNFALPPPAGSLIHSRAAGTARTELAATPPRPMSIKVLSQAPPRMFGAAEIAARLDLYCCQEGRVFRCLTDLPLSTVLLAGAEGSVIGTTQARSDRGAFVIEKGESATLAADLHDLALKDFPLLSRTAPLQSHPPGFSYQNQTVHRVDYDPSLCRVKDRLWVNDHDKVEVYANGKPIGFQMKLTIPSKSLALLGPVMGRSGGERMLVCTPGIADAGSGSPRMSLAWAAASGDGELLAVDRLSAFWSWSTPLFNRARGTFYSADAANRCWVALGPKESKLLDLAGSPEFALKNGDWIARTAAPYAVYRVISDGRMEDIASSCAQPFTILTETEDGQLVCATPEGLLWLQRKANGRFMIREKIPLHTGGFAFHWIGQDAGHLYLTLSDARRQAYLAFIERR